MKRLKELRTEKGLSQARLAARAELDPSTVNQVESGAREASPSTLRKLADALEISLYELMEDEAPKADAPHSSEADEERRKAQVWKDEYNKLADKLFRHWETQLEKQAALLADNKHDAFRSWLQEILNVYAIYTEGLATASVTTTEQLEAANAISSNTQAWGALWRRIEAAIEEAKRSNPELHWSAVDDAIVRKMLEQTSARLASA
jgi:transcriptional regulator with XRE-family HTH domain